jgi:cell fate regulator YaaT (PSP1 superfamily)
MNESSSTENATPGEGRYCVRVRLARNGRMFDCECGGMALRQGDRVMVDDRRASVLATVVIPSGNRQVQSLPGRVIRKADERDLARAEQEKKRQQEALTFGRERARAMGLPIKLFRTDIGLGSDRATFYFSCEQRVDFRALVRDLSTHLHARIEMRQVGVRDESKLTGGLGSCGRELCCSTYLSRFAPVSIKMAKHQRLVLNPTKIAGQCSRLKCCLVYEDELYVEMSKNLPKPGKRVETPEGVGRVEDLDVLAGRVRVSFFERPPMTFAASEVRLVAPPPGAPGSPRPSGSVPTAADESESGDDSGETEVPDSLPDKL